MELLVAAIFGGLAGGGFAALLVKKGPRGPQGPKGRPGADAAVYLYANPGAAPQNQEPIH